MMDQYSENGWPFIIGVFAAEVGQRLSTTPEENSDHCGMTSDTF